MKAISYFLILKRIGFHIDWKDEMIIESGSSNIYTKLYSAKYSFQNKTVLIFYQLLSLFDKVAIIKEKQWLIYFLNILLKTNIKYFLKLTFEGLKIGLFHQLKFPITLMKGIKIIILK